MRKYLVALLVLLLAVGLMALVGCGGEKETTVDTPATTSPAPAPAETAPASAPAPPPATDVYPTVDMTGFPEQLQMEIWYEAVAMEDQISIYDPDEKEKIAEAEATLCAKYGLTQLQLDKICWDAMENDWPMPPAPE